MSYQNLKKDIIDKINELANECGLSINQVCIKSHVSNSTISKFFNDPNATLTLETIEKLCYGLGTDFNKFFSDPRFNNKKATRK